MALEQILAEVLGAQPSEMWSPMTSSVWAPSGGGGSRTGGRRPSMRIGVPSRVGAPSGVSTAWRSPLQRACSSASASVTVFTGAHGTPTADLRATESSSPVSSVRARQSGRAEVAPGDLVTAQVETCVLLDWHFRAHQGISHQVIADHGYVLPGTVLAKRRRGCHR